jgi:molybdenum cofactor cytidylyltransferase
MISAILLAAGESRRMGEFKQLLLWQGKTFVECCADNLLAGGADEIVVVTGHREADIRQALVNHQVKFTFNAVYQDGMSSSIKCGVQALDEKAAALLIALADQPHIDAKTIAKIVKVYEKQKPLIVVPTFAGRRGHPIIIDAKLKEELLLLDPNVGLKQVVAAHKAETIYAEVSSDAVLIDFDFPQDFQNYLAQGK